eukprot:3474999-Pleurochrysis_carterae.AAC.3
MHTCAHTHPPARARANANENALFANANENAFFTNANENAFFTNANENALFTNANENALFTNAKENAFFTNANENALFTNAKENAPAPAPSSEPKRRLTKFRTRVCGRAVLDCMPLYVEHRAVEGSGLALAAMTATSRRVAAVEHALRHAVRAVLFARPNFI